MDWFYGLKMLQSSGVSKMTQIGLMPFFLLMLVSLLTSLFISHLYLRFYGTKGTGSTIHRAFPLLGVAITAIFVALQFSVPLSLGLLGALSIVRFRTPIKDPEEVGFILLVIATSLSCATFNMPYLIIIMIIAIIGLIILQFDKKLFRKSANEGLLVVRVPGAVYNSSHQDILAILKKSLIAAKADSILDDGQISSLTYSFSKFSDEDAGKLRNELKGLSPEITFNIFYNNTAN